MRRFVLLFAVMAIVALPPPAVAQDFDQSHDIEMTADLDNELPSLILPPMDMAEFTLSPSVAQHSSVVQEAPEEETTGEAFTRSLKLFGYFASAVVGLELAGVPIVTGR